MVAVGRGGRTLPSGTVSFLVTDIEGSTALLRRLGDAYGDILTEHHRLVRDAIVRHDGVEVSTEGDGFVIAFVDPAAAVAAAVDAQRLITMHPWPDGIDVRVRMGVHVGEARVIDDDYVSLALNQAARVVAAAHGGQIIVSSDVAGIVRGALPAHTVLEDLGAFAVRDFDGAQHLHQACHPDLLVRFPPPRVASAAVHNVPPQRTGFVGRSYEVGELVKMVEVAPLITLLGPGGIGKTRLACEAGLAVAGRFAGGVWFVPLADLQEEHLVVAAIGAAMGVVEQSGQGIRDALVDRLSASRALLVLDNCEHVIDECAQVIDLLLAACPDLAVLTTSREPLALATEHVFRLSPLPLPHTAKTAADLGACDSVTLFVQRAAQADRHFRITDDNAATVAMICSQLDGIPLALELAAARLTASSLDEVAEGLGDALTLLGSGRRGGDARLRTLAAAIDWSHDLLREQDRVVFRRLSVFRGGFTLEAADVVLGTGRSARDALGRLAAQSLLEPVPGADPPRFAQLEPIRQYAHARLQEAGEVALVEAAHVAWATERAAGREDDPSAWNLRLVAEHDNIRAALGAAVRAGAAAEAAALADRITPYWELRGTWTEGRELLRSVLALGLIHRDRARLLYQAARIGVLQGDYAATRADLDAALSIFEGLDDAEGQIGCHLALANLHLREGDFAGGEGQYLRALGLSTRAGDRLAQASCDFGLAELAVMRSDYPLATSRFESAREVYLEAGHDMGIAKCDQGLADAAMGRGEHRAARAAYDHALAAFEAAGHRMGIARCLYGLAELARTRGELRDAQTGFRRAQEMYDALGDRVTVACCTLGLAEVANAEGDPRGARRQFEEASAVFREVGDRRALAHCVYGAADAARLLGEHLEARAGFEQALRQFEELGEQRGVANARRRLGLLLCELGEIEAGIALVEAGMRQMAALGAALSPDEQLEVDTVLSSG